MKNRFTNNVLKREMGLFSATAAVVANMVGTGIFTTSGFIIQEVQTAGALLLTWFIGGVFSLCGALCYGELGSRFPQAGGEYVYLRQSFGKPMAFLSGWISLIVGFSAPIAASAIAFSTYLFQALGMPSESASQLLGMDLLVLSESPKILLAIGAVIALSLLHYQSLRQGSRVQNMLTVFKISLIIFFIGAGFFSPNADASHLRGPLLAGNLTGETFAVALVFVSFAYSGWNAASYLGGEIKHPSRNIPLALLLGTALVTGLYLLLNIVYLLALSPQKMAGVLEVGAHAADRLFGGRTGRLLNGAIAVGLLSVLSAMIITGPRVYYAMAKDGALPSLFAEIKHGHRTPANAIFLQAIIAIGMIVTVTYDKLLIYIGFTLSFCPLLTVVGLMRIRARRPKHISDYRTLGYPLTSLFFIAGQVGIIYFSIKSNPIPALWGLFTIVMGLMYYRCLYKKQRNAQGIESKKIAVSMAISKKNHN